MKSKIITSKNGITIFHNGFHWRKFYDTYFTKPILQKQVDDLQALLEEQQIAMQKLKGDYEEDKILWNKQHQEHIVSVEVSTEFKTL